MIPGRMTVLTLCTMRRVWLTSGDFELFHQDINPLEYEFFRTHMGAFKRMWQEQTHEFWSIFLRMFDHFIWNYGIMRDFPMTVEETHTYINEIIGYIQVQFVDGKVSTAKGLLMDCVVVAQNRNCVILLDKGSYTQSPFYMKETREVFRKLFGEPDKQKTYLKLLCGLQVYVKFAGAIVMSLRRWLDSVEIASDDEGGQSEYLSLILREGCVAKEGGRAAGVEERHCGEKEVRRIMKDLQPLPKTDDKSLSKMTRYPVEVVTKKNKKKKKKSPAGSRTDSLDTVVNKESIKEPIAKKSAIKETLISQTFCKEADKKVVPTNKYNEVSNTVDKTDTTKELISAGLAKDISDEAFTEPVDLTSDQSVKVMADIGLPTVSHKMMEGSTCNGCSEEPTQGDRQHSETEEKLVQNGQLDSMVDTKPPFVRAKIMNGLKDQGINRTGETSKQRSNSSNNVVDNHQCFEDVSKPTVKVANFTLCSVSTDPEVKAESTADDNEAMSVEAGAKKRLHICHYCGLEETVAKKFKRCQKCRGRPNPSYYCSKECQVKHWKTHKLEHRNDPNVTG